MWRNPYHGNPFEILRIDHRVDDAAASRRANELATRPGTDDEKKREIVEALKRIVGSPVERLLWEAFCPPGAAVPEARDFGASGLDSTDREPGSTGFGFEV